MSSRINQIHKSDRRPHFYKGLKYGLRLVSEILTYIQDGEVQWAKETLEENAPVDFGNLWLNLMQGVPRQPHELPEAFLRPGEMELVLEYRREMRRRSAELKAKAEANK